MFFYKIENRILISKNKRPELEAITEEEAKDYKDIIYVLTKIEPGKSKRYFCISDSSLFFLDNENIHLIKKEKKERNKLQEWLNKRIAEKKLCSLNINYPKWENVFTLNIPSRWRIHIVGLGDVGGMLLTGLRLLGGKNVDSIGIYDRNSHTMKRWILEANQVFSPFTKKKFPSVHLFEEDDIFNCDMFIFCATAGVPSLGSENHDVRMTQFEGNSRIISSYARKAREKAFRGIFAVVSDPVDLLCKQVFLESNKDENNQLDFMGLAPEQIRGYGLGVMNARAVYYAGKNSEMASFIREGRAFGPHGEGLIIANSIKKYDKLISEKLTNQVLKANLEIRKIGFKPYIGPALSSGSLSILATIRGKWNYSAIFLGGVYMGVKNRLHKSGIEIERLDISPDLMKKICDTYNRLETIL